METLTLYNIYFSFKHVLILPMRNGNLFIFLFSLNDIIVLILPMRNGNEYKAKWYGREIISSYPTYEEWKLL